MNVAKECRRNRVAGKKGTGCSVTYHDLLMLLAGEGDLVARPTGTAGRAQPLEIEASSSPRAPTTLLSAGADAGRGSASGPAETDDMLGMSSELIGFGMVVAWYANGCGRKGGGGGIGVVLPPPPCFHA